MTSDEFKISGFEISKEGGGRIPNGGRGYIGWGAGGHGVKASARTRATTDWAGSGRGISVNAVPLSERERDVSGIFAWSWSVKGLLTI